MMTQDQLARVMRYDPGTGKFFRLIDKRGVPPGEETGCLTRSGYVTVWAGGKNHRAHRLAFLLMTGKWPDEAVDHINGDKADNRWVNLRPATIAQNGQNMRRAHVDSQVGLLGVHMKGKRFVAGIRLDGRQRHLGCFDTPEAAHAAYLTAKAELHPFSTL